MLRYRDARSTRLVADRRPRRCLDARRGAPRVLLGLREIPLAFLLTSLVVAAIPGTGVFYTVSSSIGGGARRGVVAAFGCTLGVVPHLLAALLGLSGVMQVGAQVFEVIRYAGVVYLVFMGVSMIRDRRGELLTGSATPARGAGAHRRPPRRPAQPPEPEADPLLLRLPAPVPRARPRTQHLGKLVVLGAVFMLVTFAVFAVYAYASALLRDRVLGSTNRGRQWFQSALGAILIGIGLDLAVTDR